jgi:hypothetical protein
VRRLLRRAERREQPDAVRPDAEREHGAEAQPDEGSHERVRRDLAGGGREHVAVGLVEAGRSARNADRRGSCVGVGGGGRTHASCVHRRAFGGRRTRFCGRWRVIRMTFLVRLV